MCTDKTEDDLSPVLMDYVSPVHSKDRFFKLENLPLLKRTLTDLTSNAKSTLFSEVWSLYNSSWDVHIYNQPLLIAFSGFFPIFEIGTPLCGKRCLKSPQIPSFVLFIKIAIHYTMDLRHRAARCFLWQPLLAPLVMSRPFCEC